MPPLMVRCEYLPENILAYELGSGCGAPLASPSMVMVGTVMTGPCGEPLFQIVVFRLAFGEAEPPAVIVDRDRDVIGVIEGCGAAIESGVVEIPFRRGDLPNEFGKIVPVFFVAGPASLGGEVELIPPLQLSLWRQRHLAGFLAADQITAHRDERLAALRPQCSDNVGVRAAPIESGDGRLLDLEGIHQGDDV